MSVATNSGTVRRELVDALQLDIVGPSNDHAFARELLPESPSRWYLTGFLVPSEAPAEQKTDETSVDEIDAGGDTEGTDDATAPDPTAARRKFLPSSLGLSVLIAPGVDALEAKVSWGDYVYEGDKHAQAAEGEGKNEDREGQQVVVQAKESKPPVSHVGEGKGIDEKRGWRRIPRDVTVPVTLTISNTRLREIPVPGSGGLVLVATARPVSTATLESGALSPGTKTVSVFLVNRRSPDSEAAYRAFVFQASLCLTSATPFVARPDLRGNFGHAITDEWDDRVADLQYRDVHEHGVGHGVSVFAEHGQDGQCHTVHTTWIPSAEVERVAPVAISDVELGMEALGALTDGAVAAGRLGPLVAQYRAWIAVQRERSQKVEGQRRKTAEDLLIQAEYAAQRIDAGIGLLADAQLLDAFRIANRAMARAARQRDAIQRRVDPVTVDPPRWHPFQLAFILMTLRGIADPTHADREAVDLLFFPTGGGKTEAYLGLAAFAMVLRRLRNPGVRSAGMSVLMRYTLRLLTLDQLGRAAALTCALELEREQDKAKLGEWPFEIGLWVGQAATPNRMGRRGDTSAGREYTAYTKTMRFLSDDRKPSPIPIEDCPWCGKKFTNKSFRLVPHPDQPRDLRVHCANYQCLFTGDRPLPIVAVDEPIYRRLPAFLIATVDKFAALPWTGEVGTLFGLVERYDKDGFYGPCSPPQQGGSLDGPLLPPDLVIQDELHLISGPLGTVAGLYEAALDALATRIVDGKRIRPKIVASTATVRRAETQIRALFERGQVNIFPPPGPDRRDSFLAKTESPVESPARLYVGVAAQGRSLKVVYLRASLALLSAAQVAYEREGGKKAPQNSADPYMTLLGYFNSLRELGGSRRIVEDEVRTRLAEYSRRRRLEPTDTLFTSRDIAYDLLELTSRVPTNDVAEAKRRLALPFSDKERVDVALATNMISVGLDIIRLGLMVVLGQPKTSAEYIQATSRVGRDPERPGLVVTLLNVHKPRDRSHYERFAAYHATFYRSVEATSVTPFSPRALDRALPAVIVGLCRHRNRQMTPPLGAGEILTLRATLTEYAQLIAERARNHTLQHDPTEMDRLRANVLARCGSLLDDWLNIAKEFQDRSTKLQYQQDVPNAQRLLYDFLHPDLATLPAIRKRFRANRSMRDVEPSVDLVVKNLNEWESRP